jgi:hypothetical protein
MKQIEVWSFYLVDSVMVAGERIFIALLEKIEKQILACRFVIKKSKCNLCYIPIVGRVIP